MKTVLLGFLTLLVGLPLAGQSDALNHLNSLLLQDGGRERLADEPANYVLYEKMEAVVRGLGRTIDNQADLISYYTLEDSFLGDLTEIEQRVRELLVQKMSGILSSSDRDIIDSEISLREEDVLDVLRRAEFNTIKIFAPLLDDPALTRLITDPTRVTLDGADALLDFLSRQRTLAGTRIRAGEQRISGDQIAHERTLASQDQILLLARLLMLK